jgi:hypothetical protein
MQLNNGGAIQQLVACYLLLLCSAVTEGGQDMLSECRGGKDDFLHISLAVCGLEVTESSCVCCCMLEPVCCLPNHELFDMLSRGRVATKAKAFHSSLVHNFFHTDPKPCFAKPCFALQLSSAGCPCQGRAGLKSCRHKETIPCFLPFILLLRFPDARRSPSRLLTATRALRRTQFESNSRLLLLKV